MVVVPQLGTFRATYVPSRWIEEEEILLPPYRALTFTQQVDDTDTLFIETISANYQISTEEASIVTLEYTENIRQELAEYGNYELGSIGEFIQDESTGQIQFLSCQAGVASPELYGLDAIHIHPNKQVTLPIKEQINRKKLVNTDAKHVTISINKGILHYAMAVAASIVLFFAFSTPISDSIATKQQVTHSEFFIPKSPNFLPEISPIQTKEDIEQTSSGNELETKSATEEAKPKEIKENPSFSVVLCCGVPLQNAESYCKNLNERGINAIIDNSGKFLRILIPGFTSKEDALTEVRSLRGKSKEFSNAWIMEKK
jgi:cell division septation protein DedD